MYETEIIRTLVDLGLIVLRSRLGSKLDVEIDMIRYGNRFSNRWLATLDQK